MRHERLVARDADDGDTLVGVWKLHKSSLHRWQPTGKPPQKSLPMSANTRPRTVRDVIVANQQGIHARPSTAFVKLASKFKADVFVEIDGDTINGKSIIGLLMLAAGPGSKLKIICEGADAEDAAKALVDLVNSKFGEE